MAGGQASTKKISLAERRSMALALRRQGGSYRQIAAQLRQVEGISPSYNETQANRDVIAELNRIKESNAEQAQEVMQIELLRLDEIVSVIWPKVQKGDLMAIESYYRNFDRRARILGLAPTGVPGMAFVGPGGQLNINQSVVVYLPDNGRGDVQPVIVPNQPVALLESANAGNDRDTSAAGAANGVSQ